MSDSPLMRALSFNELDLEANRNGRISNDQNLRLQKIEADAKKSSFLGSAGNFLVAAIGLTGAAFAMLGDDLIFKMVFGSIFGIVWPLMWGAAGYSGLRRVFAKVEGTLKKTEGPVSIEKSVRSSYDSDSRMTTSQNVYELRVSGHTFIVSPVLSNLVKPGATYTVYFADFNHKERVKELLSLEPLNTSAPNAILPDSQPLSFADSEIMEWVRRGNILEAIREHRKIHGTNYEDAKAAVYDMQARIAAQK